MALKMNAAAVEQCGKPLALLEWDLSPGAEILCKTEAILRIVSRSSKTDEPRKRIPTARNIAGIGDPYLSQ
jgi:hypothetical protein